MSKIEESLSLFEKNTAKMFDIVDGLTEDQINWKMKLVLDDERWSVNQIIAHVEEVNYFWLSQFEEMLVNPTRSCGRSEEDFVIRQKAVDKADERKLSEMVENIKKSLPIIRDTLGTMTDEQMGLLFPVIGSPSEVPMGFMINHVYPEHVEFHIKHIERTLFAYSQYH
jgi:hypothetical protein